MRAALFTHIDAVPTSQLLKVYQSLIMIARRSAVASVGWSLTKGIYACHLHPCLHLVVINEGCMVVDQGGLLIKLGTTVIMCGY